MSDTPYLIALSEKVRDADLYFPRSDGTYALLRFGMNIPFDLRVYPSIFPAALLTPEMRGAKRLFLRLYGPATPPRIRPQGPFDEFVSALERWTFLFAGFLLSIAISSAFLAIYLRERVFVLQATLMAAAVLFTLVDSGLAWKYIWPWGSVGYDFADSSAFLLYLVALVFFSRTFLALDRRLRRVDAALWFIVGANCLLAYFGDQIAPGSVAMAAGTAVVNFLPFPILLGASVVRLKDGFRQARFFTLGLGGMIALFVVAGLLRHYPLARWGFDAGVAFDSLFFQFAVADRIIAANRARDEAQRTVLAGQDELVRTQREALETLTRHNEAFGRFVPREFLTLLNRDDIVAVRRGDRVEREMGVLFSDIRSFTTLSEGLTPSESFEFINSFLAYVGPVVREHNGFIDKYIGDAVMALFAGPADDALDAAIALQQAVRRFNEARARALQYPIAVGAGLHYGSLMLGTIGEERRLETTVIAGAVNVASRLEGLTKLFASRIIVSEAFATALQTPQRYHLRGLGGAHLAGLSADVGVYEVCDADEPEMLLAKMQLRERI